MLRETEVFDLKRASAGNIYRKYGENKQPWRVLAAFHANVFETHQLKWNHRGNVTEFPLLSTALQFDPEKRYHSVSRFLKIILDRYISKWAQSDKRA